MPNDRMQDFLHIGRKGW